MSSMSIDQGVSRSSLDSWVETGIEMIQELEEHGLRRFSHQALADATQGFSWNNLIGVGGFGDVFRGTMLLPAGAGSNMGGPPRTQGGGGPLVSTPIAVKRLRGGSLEEYEQFQKELLLMGCLQHPNLLRLFGFADDVNMCLVLELMEGGSLRNAQEESRRRRLVFPWSDRVRVMQQAAAGLEFLHSSSFVHRDVKPDNILLGTDYTSKLSDFGLVRVGPDLELVSLVRTRIMGTRVYMDPSYLVSGHLGYSSDVFSFGMVLMELITGQDALQVQHFASMTRGQFRDALEGRIPWSEVVDPLMGDHDVAQVRKVAELAALCTTEQVRERPSMKQVKETLDALR